MVAKIKFSDDYSELKDLHVYGDILTLYGLPIYAPVAKAGRLYNELRLLDSRILTLYVSYILAHANFYISILAGDDFAEASGERLYTTKFNNENWIDIFEILPPDEGRIFFEPWNITYEKQTGEKLGVIFVELLFRSFDFKTGREKNEAEVLVEYISKSDDLRGNESNIFIAHPRLSKSQKEDFLKTKIEIKKLLGEDVFLSTGEFTARFILDKQKRIIVEENWKDLRAKLLSRFQSKYPFLTYAINLQIITEVEEKLSNAKLKFKEGRFEDAIKDVAIACEGLLRILCSKYGFKIEERAQFYDLQCILKDIIVEEFGENTYNDLSMIREWRNRVVHFSPIKPDEYITLQIVRRANLFFEMFKRKTLLGGERLDE